MRCEYTKCKYDHNVERVGDDWTRIPDKAVELRNRNYCIHGTCTGDKNQPCECTASGGMLQNFPLTNISCCLLLACKYIKV